MEDLFDGCEGCGCALGLLILIILGAVVFFGILAWDVVLEFFKQGYGWAVLIVGGLIALIIYLLSDN